MEKKKDILTEIAYCSFFLGVMIEVLLVLIDKSAFTNPFEGRIFQITFLLFGVKVLFTRYSAKEWLVIILFTGLGAVSYYTTGRNEIIRLVMFFTACKGIDMKVCLKLVFYLTLIGCTIIVLFSLIGIYGNVSLTQDYGRGSVETRYTLGMGHPNALQCMVWALTTLGLYLYAERVKWYVYGVILVINGGFFMLTDSKTSLLVTVFSIGLAFVFSNERLVKLQKVSSIVCGGITIFCITISVIIAGNAYRVYDYVWNWDRKPITLFFVRLNDALNGRIRILVENDGFEGTISTWSLFSREENNYFFDMGWVRLFYWYGIVPACIFIGVLLLLLYYLYKEKQYLGIMMIASFALYSVIEAHAVSVYIARNYVLFLIGAYWSQLLNMKEKGK